MVPQGTIWQCPVVTIYIWWGEVRDAAEPYGAQDAPTTELARPKRQ